MSRLADGDRTAFDPLYAAAWPLLRVFTTRLLGSAADGEDAAQAALLKIFERAPSFRAGADALPWIYTIAVYECRTIRQRSRRRREDPSGDEALSGIATAAVTAEARAIEGDLGDRLRQVLADLGPADRQIIEAAWADGPRPEIAAAAFRKRLQRAVTRLRAAWEERHGRD